jgi:SAM-dependent methyltransferase
VEARLQEGTGKRSNEAVREFVGDLYEKVAAEQEGACCWKSPGEEVNLVAQALLLGYLKEDIEKVPQESLTGLGSGNPLGFVDLCEGQVVLDLGSGGGLDSFIAASRVGEHGRVIGIDMTEAMVQKARMLGERYGYENVDFSLGTVENLPLDNDSVDVVVSNCVLNLTLEKLKAFREAHRVLKPGGCMVISDMVADGELSRYVKWSFESWTGCVAGLIQKKVYLALIRESGFGNLVVLNERPFQKFGVGNNSGNEIKSIQVRAGKS